VPTLQSVLAINIELLAPEEREGMALAEEIYRHAGTPVDAWQLPQVIEQIQTESRCKGVRYPRILLRRKIEIRRGEWSPSEHCSATELETWSCRACGRAFSSADALRNHFGECRRSRLQKAEAQQLPGRAGG
jgi:hypothetical protein